MEADEDVWSLDHRLRRRAVEEEMCVVEASEALSVTVEVEEEEEKCRHEDEEAAAAKEEEEAHERPSCVEMKEVNVGASMTGDAGESGRRLHPCDVHEEYDEGEVRQKETKWKLSLLPRIGPYICKRLFLRHVYFIDMMTHLSL